MHVYAEEEGSRMRFARGVGEKGGQSVHTRKKETQTHSHTYPYLKQKPMNETRASAVICPACTNLPPRADTVKMEK